MKTSLSLFLGTAVVSFNMGCASTPWPASLPLAETNYFAGSTVVTLPGGREVPGGEVVAARTTDPAARTIVEQVVSGGNPTRPPEEYVVTMTVTGDRFAMHERSNAFEGEGTLVGAPWRWSDWHSNSKLPNGMRVESRDALTAEGMTAMKKVYAPDGAVIVSTREVLKRIDAAQFHSRRTAILASK